MAPTGLLLDIEGVLTVGWEPVPGAREAVARLRELGVPVRLVTNTTSRGRAEVADLLTGAGMAFTADEIVSAPAATAAYLRDHHPGSRCFLINEGDASADFAGIDTVVDADGTADVVVLGGAGPAYTHERLTHAFRLLVDGAPLVAMHRGLYWRTADGLSLDTGAFVAALETAADVTATVVGKPAPAFFDQARLALDLDGGEVTMVGDDLDNDVLAAQAVGLQGVLVRTGKFRAEALAASEQQPDLVVDSITDVPALFEPA